ncbi:MAG: signal peptidase I [Coraliomargaritaceae bacterium]
MKHLRKQAKELLQAAGKVYHYRKDVLSEADIDSLESSVEKLNTALEDKSTVEDTLASATEDLDSLLRRVGGKIYPKTFFSDNIEVILVAAILVIGIRTFFFQPFIIPTNSMYPTYSGMNSVVYDTQKDAAPSLPERFLRFITLGAKHKSLTANESGEVSLLVYEKYGTNYRDIKKRIRGPKWIVLKGWFDQYTFYVNGEPHTLTLPADFDINPVLAKAFQIPINETLKRNPDLAGTKLLPLGKSVEAGQKILSFDITLGDALFVDRMSYHFRKPKVGDPFVFRTDDILDAVGRATNDYTPKYYIKRIAGVEEETLEIRNGELLVDGQPRDEKPVFLRNAQREGEYSGYVNQQLLDAGIQMNVPEGNFVALGDNSANSADSRYWGFVPENSVIGKAFFVYYPFTKRWGPSE